MEMDPSSVNSYFVICIFLVLKNPTNKLNMHFHFVWSFWQTISEEYPSRFIDRWKTERGVDYYDSLQKPLHESSHCSPLQLLQTIIPINTTETLLSAKPLAPSKFLGTTIWGVKSSLFKAMRKIYDHLHLFIFCAVVHSLLVQCGILRNTFPW